jgi:uncharacterized protein YdaU (DUF1376 family)
MTRKSRPEPLTTPDIDVRDLDSFMLNTERLMASELYALSTGDEFKAAVALWCRAWKQIPPASLPNDERILAAFSGAADNWPTVRDMALRGFILCSDGRLYHRVLSDDARSASEKKKIYVQNKISSLDRKQRERDDRAKMFNQLKEKGITPEWNISTRDLRALVTQPVTVTVTANTGTGTGTKKKETQIPSLPHQEKVRTLSNGHGGKNGTTTIANPVERIARFQTSLAKHLNDRQIVIDSVNLDAPNHHAALAKCRQAATELGKGWPINYPAEHMGDPKQARAMLAAVVKKHATKPEKLHG